MAIQNRNVGRLIRELRKAKGMTQKQLAEKSGVAAITIRKYENEPDRQPRIEQLGLIANALDVSVLELLMGKSIGNIHVLREIKDVLKTRRNAIKEYYMAIGFKYRFEGENEIVTDRLGKEYILDSFARMIYWDWIEGSFNKNAIREHSKAINEVKAQREYEKKVLEKEKGENGGEA